MTGILSIDIETKNFSHEIGGWGNTHLFEPTVVATWDGTSGTVYCNKAQAKEFLDKGVTVKPLHAEVIGKDIEAHIANGGKVIGHNIVGFDLPILRDSLDCWSAGDILGKAGDCIIDTSAKLRSAAGSAIPLADACMHTLGKGKAMKSHDAPLEWRKGNYGKVADYCLKDAQLAYELWEHGNKEGFVKARCRKTGIVKEFEINW